MLGPWGLVRMALYDQRGEEKTGTVDSNEDTEELLHPNRTNIKTEEEEEEEEDLQAPKNNRLLVVIKAEPEELKVSLNSDEDQLVPSETKCFSSLVVIKTEPDLQTIKSENENRSVPQQEEPSLPPLWKTEPDTVDTPQPLYSTADQRTEIRIWSVQHVDCKQKPVSMKDHEHFSTNEAGPPSSAKGKNKKLPDKKTQKTGKHGKCVSHKKCGKEDKRIKSYSCSECGYVFSKASILYNHMYIHTGKKIYQCSQCEKSFTERRSFKTHQRIHTGEEPYKCTQCGKTFSRMDALQTHQRIHTGEKPYHCSHCGKSFNRLDVYQIHCRIHTGEKPYQCSQCGKAFMRLDVYQNHQRIHTGEKPYLCSTCGRRFLNLSNLRNHERIHTNERPYRCSLCEKSFIQSGALSKHLRAHTRKRLK